MAAIGLLIVGYVVGIFAALGVADLVLFAQARKVR